MKQALPFILVAGVGLGALVGGTLLYHAKKPSVAKLSQEQSLLANARTGSAHIRGNSNAPVTLEEFGDFECPPCGALVEPVNGMIKDYRGRVRLIFSEFPLSTHAYSFRAALAAEAAGLQGHFWEMHDLIYREQSAWSHARDAQQLFEAFAGTLGLEVERFKKDCASEQVKGRVLDDEKRAVKLGVTMTPAIFVNGAEVPRDSLRRDRLHAFVDAVLKTTATP